MSEQRRLAEKFRSLHDREDAFVIPNPWDVGSARMLVGLGFEALATTSSGFAQTLGRPDGSISLDEKITHVRAICAAVDIPVSVDLENGFGHKPEAVEKAILAAAEAGAVGASIEDHTGDPTDPIYDRSEAIERIQAAVEAARSTGIPFVLTARCENLLWGRLDLDDTIDRLCAFEAAGADVLYAPGLSSLAEVKLVTDAVARPVNVLGPMVSGGTVESLAKAGAKRISVGGALNKAAMGGLLAAATQLARSGSFDWARNAEPVTAALNLAP